MRTSFLILLSVFSFSFLVGQVTLTANFPASLTQGNAIIIDVKINKGNVINFAKYQMDVPEGLVVTEIDSKGGNFTFENNRAKIVWVSIPSEPEFSIKLKIYPSGASPASATIAQRLAFLLDGSKKEIEAPTVIITVLGAENIMGSHKKPPIDPKDMPVKSAEPVKSAPVKTEPVAKTEPMKDEPSKVTEPAKTEPVKAEPAKVAPTAKAEVVTAEPVKEPAVAKVEAPKAEPVKIAEPVKTEPINTTPVVKAEPAKAAPVAKLEPPKADPAIAIPGLIYKIQLAASPAESVKEKFVTLGSGLTWPKEDGSYKVLYGTYNTKEEALKAREELIAKGFTGFLVKYQNGTRVK